MTQPDKHDEELSRLGAQLDEFDASRARKVKAYGEAEGASEGYRLMALLIGGVIGGLGLGWLVDRVAHTSPFGLIGGLLIGTAASVYMIVRSASRASDSAPPGPAAAPVLDDDDNGG
jgi:ATP synthase protein I